MNARAEVLIQLLGLEPHPEGGHFAELFRSPYMVRRRADGAERTALTTIYYLLQGEEVSRWHRVLGSDEAWHYYEGAPLELLQLDPDGNALTSVLLGPAGDACRPAHVVRAGCWQAARTTGAYTLVGCTVGPGFEFDDFTTMAEEPSVVARVRERFPQVVGLV